MALLNPGLLLQVSAIQSIDSQLDKFAAEMESDGSVQRARVRKLLDAELERSVAAVSSTLQLSNITSLSSYIWGGDSKKSSELPIATVRSRKFHIRLFVSSRISSMVYMGCMHAGTCGTVQRRECQRAA